MLIYRCHLNADISNAFSTNSTVAGRWNFKNRKAIYCAQTLSLATSAWLGQHALSPFNLSFHWFSVEIQERDIQIIHPDQLPSAWSNIPATDAGRKFAEKILYKIEGPLCIAVPSCAAPDEREFIVNPLHPKYAKIRDSIKYLGERSISVRKITAR